MKRTCDECYGEGVIECEECGAWSDCKACKGEGNIFCCISKAFIDPVGDHGEELLALQKDARKAIRDAAELTKLRPSCAKGYAWQLEAALRLINRQADEVLQTGKGEMTI